MGACHRIYIKSFHKWLVSATAAHYRNVGVGRGAACRCHSSITNRADSRASASTGNRRMAMDGEAPKGASGSCCGIHSGSKIFGCHGLGCISVYLEATTCFVICIALL